MRLALLLCLLPLAAYAQTYDYAGTASGTVTSLPSGTVGAPDGLPLTPAPITGTITGTVTEGGPGGTSNSWSFTFVGSNGFSFTDSSNEGPQALTGEPEVSTVTASTADPYNSSDGIFVISPSGADSFTFTTGEVPGGVSCRTAQVSNILYRDGNL